MKLIATISLALLGSVLATPTPFTDGFLASRDDGDQVPGNTAFHFCRKSSTHDEVEIKRLTFHPEKPVKGADLTIAAMGELQDSKKELRPGSLIKFNVKWHGVGKELTYDVCTEAEGVECPVTGSFNLTKTIKLPKNMPGHDYKIEATLVDSGQKELTCMKAEVDIE